MVSVCEKILIILLCVFNNCLAHVIGLINSTLCKSPLLYVIGDKVF